MRKQFALSFLVLFTFTTLAFAHAGEVHRYMGTITMLHGDNAFMMKLTNGKEMTITTSASTTYLDANNHAAKRSDLAVGMRVVVKMSIDGKVATVRMSAAQKK
jgi:hypothetical protein